MKTTKLPLQKHYPKKIYFTNECYTVIFRKGLGHYAETDSDKKTIVIKDGLSPRMLLSTFVHELIHVIEFERPLKIKHKKVYELEISLVELLLDNFL